MAERVLVILRGLPGCGKSTFAQKLGGTCLSSDDFFLDAETGSYNFNNAGLASAHVWNQERCELAMEKGDSLIVIDNCNLQAAHAAPYVRLADKHGYKVQIQDVVAEGVALEDLVKMNVHGVSLDALKVMNERREQYFVKDARNVKEDRKDEELHKKYRARLRRPTEEQAQEKEKKTGGKIRVEVCKNDGRANPVKPLVLNTSASVAEAVKSACGKVGSTYSSGKSRMYDVRGMVVEDLSSLAEGARLFVAADGKDFVPVKLKQTQAEKKAAKAIANAPDTNAMAILQGLHSLPSGASLIFENLYVGSGRDGRDVEQISRIGFETIVNVAKEWPALSDLPVCVKRYVRLHLLDETTQLLDACQLSTTFAAIEDSSGPVLIHCVKGSSRSAAVAAAYLVRKKGMSASQAMKLLQKQRPQICINPAFVQTLAILAPERPKIGPLLLEHGISASRFLQKFAQSVEFRQDASHVDLEARKFYRVAHFICGSLDEMCEEGKVESLVKEQKRGQNWFAGHEVVFFGKDEGITRSHVKLACLDYLNSHGKDAAAQMAKEFDLKISRHERYRQLHQFSYSSQNSCLELPVVSECRGIILEHVDGGWNVVALPFLKFFNLGDPRAADFDWSNFVTTEKLDGMMVILYWYGDEWQVATQSVADGSNSLAGGETVKSAFFRIFQSRGYKLPSLRTVTYMFELLSPLTQVVVSQSEEDAVLIGARDMETLCELNPCAVAASNGWRTSSQFVFGSQAEVVAAAKCLVGTQCEGYVVCDSKSNRLKIKAPSYVMLFHLRGDLQSIKPLQLAQIVVQGEQEEVKAYFPDLGPKLEPFIKAFQEIRNDGVDQEELARRLAKEVTNGEAEEEAEEVVDKKAQKHAKKAARREAKKGKH